MPSDFGFAVKRHDVNKDVTDCAVTELAASSAFNSLKIYQEGTTTIYSDPASPLTARTTVSHTLNFNPKVLAFIQIDPGLWQGTTLGLATSNYVRFTYWSEGGFTPGDRRLVLSAVIGGSSSYTTPQTFQVKYFIFGDTAKEQNTLTELTGTNDHGIKVMKKNGSGSYYDGATDNYIEHISWSSRMPPMKLSHMLQMPVTCAAGNYGQTIYTHNLGYAPAFIAFRELSSSYRPTPWASAAGASPTQFAEVYSTDTFIRVLEWNGTASPYTVNYRVAVLAEKASTT